MWLLITIALLSTPEPEKVQRRYEVETLYVIHHRLTPETYPRLEKLFSKAFPAFDRAKLNPKETAVREYYAMYKDRLLRAVSPKKDPQLVDKETGLKLTEEQINRELRTRTILSHLLAEARRCGSVKAVFDGIVRKDNPRRPVCATEPGKGLLVYRLVTAEAGALEDLADSGVRFDDEFRRRVVQVAATEPLPAFGSRACVLGANGHGRHIFRLLRILRHPGTPQEGAKPS